MKAEPLEEADGRRKDQSSGKGKPQGAVVDLPFVFVVRAKKSQQEQDRGDRSCNSQTEEGRAESSNSASKTDGNDGEKRRCVED
jgi:hypothetical protein